MSSPSSYPTPEQAAALAPNEAEVVTVSSSRTYRLVRLVNGRYQVQHWNAMVATPRYTPQPLTAQAERTHGSRLSYSTHQAAVSAYHVQVRKYDRPAGQQ